MNVGFRPRLKARPSLYDLVRNRNIDNLSVRPNLSFSDELPPELPPLPPSPTSTPSPPSTPRTPRPLEHVKDEQTVKMPPKKAAIKDDDESQYGRLKALN